jgi:antirestriction protein
LISAEHVFIAHLPLYLASLLFLGVHTPKGDEINIEEKAMNNDIMIYVADLAAYNNGTLHGVWIDATQDLITIQTAVECMLKRSPIEDAEEYAIHDYQGFGQYSLSEYEGLESANNVACFIEEYPNFGTELLNYYSDIDEAKKVAEENYHGTFESLADYAQQLTEETSDVPEHLAFYIDYDKMGRDMEMSGDIFSIEVSHCEVHIFWSH